MAVRAVAVAVVVVVVVAVAVAVGSLGRQIGRRAGQQQGGHQVVYLLVGQSSGQLPCRRGVRTISFGDGNVLGRDEGRVDAQSHPDRVVEMPSTSEMASGPASLQNRSIRASVNWALFGGV